MKDIAFQSLPASLNMISVALGMFIINFFLNRFDGTHTVAAYGIGLRIEQIALLPAFGLNTALLAVTGQNTGAGRIDRVRKAYAVSLLYGVVLLAVTLVFVLPLSENLVSLFTGDPKTARYASFYLRIVGIAYFSYMTIFCSNSVLQGMKKPAFILAAGLFRQIAAPAAVFYYVCCVKGLGAEGIFVSIAAINWTAAAASLLYTLRVLNPAGRNSSVSGTHAAGPLHE